EPFASIETDLAIRYPLASREAVLRKIGSTGLPGTWVLLLCLITPPVFCLVWYQAWRSRYPDVARAAARRRSRASRLAFKALRGIPAKLNYKEGAAQIAAIMGRYLEQRLNSPGAEPTPPEVADVLKLAGVSSSLAEQFAHLFSSCDAVRFAPVEWSSR